MALSDLISLVTAIRQHLQSYRDKHCELILDLLYFNFILQAMEVFLYFITTLSIINVIEAKLQIQVFVFTLEEVALIVFKYFIFIVF